MKNIETEIIIDSGVANVWNVLTNFDAYPIWNPFIKSIKGEKKVGQNLIVSIKPPNSKGMTFKPIITQLNANSEFRWKGKFLMPGIFDGEHYFRLFQLNVNQTKLIQGETFSGILVGLMSSMLNDTEEGFKQMNLSLKKECEKIG